MKNVWRATHIGLVVAFGLLLAGSSPAQLPIVRIGVVVDGAWERNREILGLFQNEIWTLTRDEFDVRFPEEKIVEGDWTLETIRNALDRLLEDPDVDLVLAMGTIVGDTVCRYPDLPKPVLAPFIIDARVQGLPRGEDGASGVPNLGYLTGTITVQRALEVFQEITPFRHLVSLNTGDISRNIPGLRDRLNETMRQFQSEWTAVQVETSADEVLAALPEEADAVLVYPLLRLRPGELDRLVAGLIERQLPSFAMFFSTEYVRQGVLAGLSEDPLPRRARRVALNLQRILLGEDPGTFPVDFAERESLVINMATARAINTFPSFALMTVAELINEERRDIDRQVNLRLAVEEAIEENLDLRARDREVAAGEKEIPIAKSVRLPQIDVSAAGIIIDRDRAGATFQPERAFSPSMTLTQVIYSEPANANVTVQTRLQEARVHDRRSLRLDIVRDAATAYLNVLRTKTTERILRNNLELTRSNLERARVREAIGAAGPSEVYRWESEIAANRSEVIAAAAVRNQAEIALNRLLNRPLEEPFLTEEMDLTNPTMETIDSEFRPYVSDNWHFDIFRDFMVREGLDNSPELQAFDAVIDAQSRSLTASRRAFFAPDIFFQGSVERPFYGGASSSGGIPPELFPDVTLDSLGDINWTLAFDVSLPLFTSGERPSARDRDIEELSRLRFERAATAERIEQRIRSAMHVAGASYAGIALAQQAAGAARANLELVTDSYSRGAISIIDLLDAQNASLVSDEAAANAVYDFLINFIEVERSVGRFYFLAEPEERERLFDRADAFYRDLGAPPPRRNE